MSLRNNLVATVRMIAPGVLVALATVTMPGESQAGVLWLGNDNASGTVFQTDTLGNVLSTVTLTTGTTGIAFNGTSLFLAGSNGVISERSADGSTVFQTFNPSPVFSEDLAWDSTRNRLWRITHNAASGSPSLLRIDTTLGILEQSFQIPSADPGTTLTPLGGLGLAYDPTRDRLYASFCKQGCSAPLDGVVMAFDPSTGLVDTAIGTGGVLFRKTGMLTGGLGYDPLTDTLWMTGGQTIFNVQLDGTVLSSFAHPGPFFADGLEFIPSSQTPEPATSGLFGLALIGLGFLRRRRGRS